MRSEFDAAFALPARGRVDAGEPLILVRLARDLFALRTETMSGIVKGRRIVKLPTRSTSLLGIVGLRGRIVPVHDLARVLALCSDGASPDWIALGGTDPPLGFAFASYEGHVLVSRDRIRTENDATPGRGREVVETEDGIAPLVDLRALSAALRTGGEKEKRS